MKTETTYTDFKKAHAWYVAVSEAGFAATLETIIPGYKWRVVVFK